MAFETVLYEAQGPIGTIILNRPEKLNAFSRQEEEKIQARCFGKSRSGPAGRGRSCVGGIGARCRTPAVSVAT